MANIINEERQVLTDDDPLSAPPAGITVSAGEGGIVQAATGETVMIGAGALAADTVVAIRRIDLAQLTAETGLTAPAPGVLQSVAAFRLNLGEQVAGAPLQLAIPLSGAAEWTAGEEVVFFKKGQVLHADGSTQTTWWLVDNGFLGADGIARTASRPYPCIDQGGEYVVCKRLPGVIGTPLELAGAASSWLTFGGLNTSLGGISIVSEIIGILASAATGITAGSYHFGVPQFVELPPLQIAPDGRLHIDLPTWLPPTPTPWGNVVVPQISSARIADDNSFRLTLANPDPGRFVGQLMLRLVFANGSTRNVWATPQAGDLSGEITVTPPPGIAIGSVGWQVVRQISSAQLNGSGGFTDGTPLEFAGNLLRPSPRPQMAALLTRSGVEFVRQSDHSVVGAVNLLDTLGAVELDYLWGRKIQPVVFSDDLSRVFIAGKAQIIVIDMLTLSVIERIQVSGIGSGLSNITSLASVGHLLLIGEGGNGGGNRLLVLDIDPQRSDPGQVDPDTGLTTRQAVSLKGTGVEASRNGVGGMVLGPDGHTLVISLPAQNDNLVGLNAGASARPVIARLPDDGRGGRTPLNLTATQDSNRYLVANINSTDRGLATLVLTRDANGRVTDARMTAIPMNQPDSAIRIDRLNIQRTQSAVLVTVDGVEYAIVGDDTIDYNDPYYRAMYEAPEFMYLPPFGMPTAVGGSASAKKVNVGGKLGIVKDPFGQAEYLGATLPLDGYGIINLALSEDGSVLIGQLKGGYSGNMNSPNYFTQLPNQVHAWDVGALIAAALAQAPQARLSQNIRLPEGAEQLISPRSDNPNDIGSGRPIGTFFDPEDVQVTTTGNMGDIIAVNLRELAARKLLFQDKQLSAAELSLDWDKLSAASQAKISRRMADLSEIELLKNDLERLVAGGDGEWEPSLQLVAEKNASGKIIRDAYGKPTPLSRQSATSTQAADYTESGVLFFTPNLSANDVNKLRAGETVLEKYLGFFFRYKDAADRVHPEAIKEGYAQVTAKDYANVANTFFGDRPLDNPGYSAFTLSGSVGIGQKNDVLDVYRVEQRLKYLGYPAMGTGKGNTLKDFSVDGKFATQEQAALKLFEKVVRYENSGNAARYNLASNGADGLIEDSNTDQAKVTKDWLNAYNTPHWMELFGTAANGNGLATNNQLPGWTSSQIGAANTPQVERYATSWVRDLMRAASYAPANLRGTGALTFNGAVDANLGITPDPVLGHSTHDLGMAFDLGISDLVRKTNAAQFNVTEALITELTQVLAAGEEGVWDSQRAAALAARLSAAVDNNQARAMLDFLSLYSITRQAGGAWTDLPIVNDTGNATTIRSALFGNGTVGGSLISKVLIGGKTDKALPAPNASWYIAQNPYRNMRLVLDRLGVPHNNDPQPTVATEAGPVEYSTISGKQVYRRLLPNGTTTHVNNHGGVPAHQSHFHIYVRVPDLVEIGNGSQHLLTSSAAGQQSVDSDNTANSDGEASMLIYDMPIDLPHDNIVVAQLAQSQQIPAITLDWPWIVPSDPQYTYVPGRFAAILEKDACNSLLQGYKFKYLKWTSPSCKLVEIVTQPKHGTLVDEGNGAYGFKPEPGYLGKDSFQYIVEGLDGRRVRITMPVLMQTMAEAFAFNSQNANQQGHDLNNGSSLASVLTAATQNLTFADLNGSELGQTLGTGPTAQITLDDNAAGHGWYIDYTPYLNDEYLPTSNPLEWIARPGSEAAGKMDLLSVLLHEVGHALGLNHSADPHALMSTTLPPGVRRLPSAAELSLMAELLAVVKETGSASFVPYDPFSPPGTPLPMSISLAAFIAARQRRPSPSSALTQFDIAAQPSLSNPAFTDGAGWSTTGDLRFNAGTATLQESASTQTRLNQTFVLGANDRFLSFTLSGIALDDMNNAPDDAFEVALIDANTGLSRFGTPGLSHSDAFYNLQADGSEFKAAGVTTVRNADGSRRVLVDLAALGAPLTAGTVVSLSFDLIGFGQGAAATRSQVTVKALRLGVSQEAHDEAHDDTATLAEDGVLDVDVLANDLGADQAGIVPVLVSGPAHGSLERTADGRYRYRPDADWSGEDSFSYRLSDGTQDSNIALVTLTITPVNDAPSITPRTVTLNEDTSVTLNLLQGASDIDGDALTVTVTTAPAHGNLTQNADGTWTYVPTANWHGTDTLVYAVSDGTLSTTGVLALVVNAVNDAPSITPRTVTLNEDTSVILNLLQGASDIDGDALTVTVTTAPAHGNLTQNADGTWTYVPTAHWHGTDTLVYVVSDGTLSTTGVLALVVNAVNDAPSIAPRTLTLDEDSSLRIDLLQGASDIDGDALTVTTAPQHGNLTQNADGTWTYVPTANWHGTDTLVYEVSDGTLSTTGVLALVVNALNDAPSITPRTVTLNEDSSVTLNLRQGASDIDGDALTITVTTAPAHGNLTQNADGTWTYVPTAHWHGTDTLVYQVSDGTLSTTGVLALVVNAVNDVPVNDPPVDTTPLIGWNPAGVSQAPTAVNGNALATASHPLPLPAPAAGSLPAGEFDAFDNRLISFSWAEPILADDNQLLSFGVPGAGVADPAGRPALSAKKRPNQAPTWFSKPPRDAQDAAPGSYQAVAVDADGDTVTYRLLEGPEGATIDPESGQLNWPSTRVGTLTFRIEADDGRGGKSEQRFTLKIKAAGRASADPAGGGAALADTTDTADTAKTLSLSVLSAAALALTQPLRPAGGIRLRRPRPLASVRHPSPTLDWAGSLSRERREQAVPVSPPWRDETTRVPPPELTLAQRTGLCVPSGTAGRPKR